MKNNLILFFVLLAIQVFAQVQFNPQIGFSVTDVRSESNLVDVNGRIGFLTGGDFRIGKRLYVQPGAFYSRYATVFKPAGPDTFQITSTFEAIRFKLLGGYNLINSDGFKLRLNAGVAYDLLVEFNDKIDKGNFITLPDPYNRNLLSAQAGIGVDIWLLSAELGYVMGFSDIYNKDYRSVFQLDKTTLGSFYFTVGFVLGKNKKD
jgi:hypothetical protein